MLDPLAPLSIGNGEFAFTADVTGLQTFPQFHENAMPLCTMSQWGWHTSPLAPGLNPKAFRLALYDTHGREVGYRTSSEGQTDLYNWLRENPHRLHLGRIGLRIALAGGAEARPQDLTSIEQKLDLWSGILTSRFAVEGNMVSVRTAVHHASDLLAVAVESPLIAAGRLAVRFEFPYGAPAMPAADWSQPARHKSTLVRKSDGRAEIHRFLDADEYFTTICWKDPASFTSPTAHHFLLSPSTKGARLEFTAAFAPHPLRDSLPTAGACFAGSEQHWGRFWSSGGAVDLAGSKDPRAQELERRIVLSQYLTAIQCAGSMPPQETGLTVNSWYGKFHLEMHWWHAAHFALWNRLPMLEKSLGWYLSILPVARQSAGAQGYAGARWPKMVGPEGQDSPSPIGPLLIWQQPHPIFYAELSYRSHRNRRILDRYWPLVHESATFMGSYAHLDGKANRYQLGPPLIPAQENHPPRETWNPVFELEYWRFGLQIAQRWRERLGMNRDPGWDDILSRLSALPAQDGIYLAHENCPQTFTERNSDHPSMLGALGMLPGDGIDRETMRRTLARVMKEWQWDKTWGWDYPLTAMTAARLGEPQLAVDALLMTTVKNRYLPNGHNWQRDNLPCYLPGNGGLLYAVAMMAAGWRGAPQQQAPGFPSNGSWSVRWEKLAPAL
jgi:protein-glucosylgalactosylhydroxylysine glucosidase